jgi:hypothetical protein
MAKWVVYDVALSIRREMPRRLLALRCPAHVGAESRVEFQDLEPDDEPFVLRDVEPLAVGVRRSVCKIPPVASVDQGGALSAGRPRAFGLHPGRGILLPHEIVGGIGRYWVRITAKVTDSHSWGRVDVEDGHGLLGRFRSC